MKQFRRILVIMFALPIFGQQNMTLQECYELASVNYPLVKESQLYDAQNQQNYG